MGRPFDFPTPQSVTIGNPTMFVPAERVLNLYNQDSDNPKAINFSQRVRDWFIHEAYAVGWSNAGVDGGNTGILLVANVQVIPHPTYPQLT